MTPQILVESHNSANYQAIEIGRAVLSLPTDVDPKPYIRTLLKLELESMPNPAARAAIERGLAEATSNADFASLLETFHLLSSPANADRLLAALERSNVRETPGQSVESLRKEFDLGEKPS
ncbi:MAG: hypothetical protein ACKO7W_21345 [Elainella sp.]